MFEFGGKSWIEISKIKEKNITIEEDSLQSDLNRLEALFYIVWNNKNKLELDNLLELGTGSNQFQYFLFIGIIEEINEQMRELRRSYNELRIQTSTLRGSLDFAASIPLIASGSPERVCVTEEFSITTPHYSALMTAIDVVVSTPSQTKNSMFDQILDKLRSEASITRSRFREIPSMPYGMAIRTLRSTSIPPQLRKWKKIFEFALHLLEGDGVHSNNQTLSTKPYSWQSSKFWEFIIEKIVKSGYSTSIDSNKIKIEIEPKMSNPWKRENKPDSNKKLECPNDAQCQFELPCCGKRNCPYYRIESNKKPDIVIFDIENKKDLIIDAKYYSSIDDVMSSDSNFQMLGYALTEFKEPYQKIRERRVHFAVPSKLKKGEEIVSIGLNKKGKEQSWQLQYPFTILDKEGSIDPKLHGLEIQFPQPKVFLPNFSNDSGEDYFTEAGESLRAKMDDLNKSDYKSPDLEQLESRKKDLKEQIKSLTKQIKSLEQ